MEQVNVGYFAIVFKIWQVINSPKYVGITAYYLCIH